MKKLIAKELVLLAAVLLAGMGSASAFEVDGLTYRVIDNDAKTVRVSYKGSDEMINPYTQTSVVIPSTVQFNGNTYTVVEIGDYAFHNASLTSISIPSTVKTLGNGVFRYCNTIKSIDLSTIETFGNSIFFCCEALTSVKLPETMYAIPPEMFSSCSNIKSFTFPKNISSIGYNAFSNTGLTSLTIPETISNIDYSAFSGCTSLTKVVIMCNYIWGNSMGGIFANCNNINTIVCFTRNGFDFGFTEDVKETASLYVPESQISNWTSSFLNVKAAGINSVGGHVIDVPGGAYYMDANYMGQVSGNITINGKTADQMYGQAFVIEPGSNVEIGFTPNTNLAWKLTSATINGTDVTSSLVDGNYTINNISGNQLVRATWLQGATYNVRYSASDYSCGTLFANDRELSMYNNNAAFPANQNISIVVKPNAGYSVTSFYVNGTDVLSQMTASTDGSYSYQFTLQADAEISVTYSQQSQQSVLQTTFNEGGTVTVAGEIIASGAIKSFTDAMVEVKMMPDAGYELASVIYNGVDVTTTWIMSTTDGASAIYPVPEQGTNQTLEITFRKIGGSVTPTDYEYVDLGLPSGTKWATMNVGATSLSDEGDFFAWGETTTKAEYTSSNYIFGSGSSMTKYNNSDNLTILQPEDDAATVKWGEGWRTPTIDDWRELNNRCTKTYTSVNGVGGYLFTGTNGNTIFLPGQQENLWGNVWGSYWSSSVNASDKQYAWNIDFDGGGFYIDEYNDRSMKGNIRPVREGNLVIPTEQCATPTITYADGQLQFECETEGAECHYKITSSDISEGIGNLVPLSATYHISVYATKSGYLDSDTATYQVEWTKQAGIRGDTNGDGVVDVEDVVETVNIILEQ